MENSEKDKQMIHLDDVQFLGKNLVRPECVLCNAHGRVFAANFDGGVTVVEPDGHQWDLIGHGDVKIKPNGVALEADGTFLLTHLGDTDGGVYRLHPDGTTVPFVLELEGQPLPPTNFVYRDGLGRVWITVSTRLMPRMRGYRDDHADGFIVLADKRGVRIAADGLGYTNECILHPDGKRLFVNETFSKRVSWFDVADDGSLSARHVFRELGPGEFPDGLAFDENGDVWIVCVVSNRIIRLGLDGSRDIIAEDADPDRIAWAETAFREKKMWTEHMKATGSRFRNVSSLAFGGSDRKTLYLGCLLGDALPYFRVPVAGAKPPHWDYAGPAKPRLDSE